MDIWLVVLTILKNISQWEGLSMIILDIMENKKCLKHFETTNQIYSGDDSGFFTIILMYTTKQ